MLGWLGIVVLVGILILHSTIEPFIFVWAQAMLSSTMQASTNSQELQQTLRQCVWATILALINSQSLYLSLSESLHLAQDFYEPCQVASTTQKSQETLKFCPSYINCHVLMCVFANDNESCLGSLKLLLICNQELDTVGMGRWGRRWHVVQYGM